MIKTLLEFLIISICVGFFVAACVAWFPNIARGHWEDPKACTERLAVLATSPSEMLYTGPSEDQRDYIERWRSMVDGTVVEVHYYQLPVSQPEKHINVAMSFWLDREENGFYEEVFFNTKQFATSETAGNIIPNAACENFVHLEWDGQAQRYVLITTGKEHI